MNDHVSNVIQGVLIFAIGPLARDALQAFAKWIRKWIHRWWRWRARRHRSSLRRGRYSAWTKEQRDEHGSTPKTPLIAWAFWLFFFALFMIAVGARLAGYQFN